MKFLTALAVLPLVSCVPYIHVDGSNFVVNGTNRRFDVIGVEYVPHRTLNSLTIPATNLEVLPVSKEMQIH